MEFNVVRGNQGRKNSVTRIVEKAQRNERKNEKFPSLMTFRGTAVNRRQLLLLMSM